MKREELEKIINLMEEHKETQEGFLQKLKNDEATFKNDKWLSQSTKESIQTTEKHIQILKERIAYYKGMLAGNKLED